MLTVRIVDSHRVLLLQHWLMATEMLENFLIAALVHVVAVDLEHALTGLKTC